MIFKSPPLTALALILASLSPAVAEDQLTMKNKDHFIGKVLALKDGLIELETPHSQAPLQILDKDLAQLDFQDSQPSELPKNSQVIRLRNGDRFPGEVTSLSQSHLGLNTWFAGALEIPRSSIDSVHFGMTPQKIILQGPQNIDNWTQDNSGGWTLRNQQLVSSKATFIGKNLKLPESFIFKVAIAWTSNPKLRIHLCSDQLSPTEKETGDSYLIAITSNGIDVKRVMPPDSPGPAYRTLITHSAKLAKNDKSGIQLELRVNRANHSIQLYLDGEKLELGIDPATPPSGSHVLFESLSATESNTKLGKIHVHEWDSSTQHLRYEKREAEGLDTLAVAEGDRFSGQVTRYDAAGPAPLFTVQSPLSAEPIQIPLAHCAVLYFAQGEQSEEISPKTSPRSYQLDLRNGGRLTLSDIRLSKTDLSASHPWLGQLQIDRRIMQSISTAN